jgi:hypothetical protein
MKKIIKEKNIPIGICNGDLMESVATERGLATERDLKMVKKILAILESKLGIKIILNMGNHESGYVLPLSTDEDGGVSEKSIKNFLKLTGRDDIYYSFVDENREFRFILIPYILTEEFAKNCNLLQIKKEFKRKLRQDLKNSSQPVIIFMHDPDSLMDQELLEIIRSNQKKIEAIFYGHYHSKISLLFLKIMVNTFNLWWLILPRVFLNIIFWIISGRDMKIARELGKYFRSRKNIPEIIKELNMTLVPAPTGMFGFGGGFMVLEVKDKKSS